MSSSATYHTPVKNKLLASLPGAEYERLLPHLKQVSLPVKETLCEAGERMKYAYFPLSGMISMLSIEVDGVSVEVGVIGNDGMLGLPICLGGGIAPNQTIVQIAAIALRVRADVLRTEFSRAAPLHALLLRYTQAFFTQVSQSAACNRLHSLDQRLCRWLLVVHDRVQSDHFRLTQQFIAHMLGTRRAGVSEAAIILQSAGLIRYTHGKIHVLDREGLESRSCDCYRIVKDMAARLMA
jgi:CRP-like cAMP-binding protein